MFRTCWLALVVLGSVLAVPGPAHARSSADVDRDLGLVAALDAFRSAPVRVADDLYKAPSNPHAGGPESTDVFVPPREGHTLLVVQSRVDNLTRKIDAAGGNPHNKEVWRVVRDHWMKVGRAMVAKLDRSIRARRDAGDELLVGMRSFAELKKEALAAQARLQSSELSERGRSYAAQVRGTYLRSIAKDLAAQASMAGRWKIGDGWGPLVIRIAGRRLSGTWGGGKNGRDIRGTVAEDGLTAKVRYRNSSKDEWQDTVYTFTLYNDGQNLSITPGFASRGGTRE